MTTDFKMENVLLNGFDDDNPASDDESVPLMINVKLADHGSGKKTKTSKSKHLNTKLITYTLALVMPPASGEVTSITYKSPEVYFNKPWTSTSAIDIWAWGIAVSIAF